MSSSPMTSILSATIPDVEASSEFSPSFSVLLDLLADITSRVAREELDTSEELCFAPVMLRKKGKADQGLAVPLVVPLVLLVALTETPLVVWLLTTFSVAFSSKEAFPVTSAAARSTLPSLSLESEELLAFVVLPSSVRTSFSSSVERSTIEEFLSEKPDVESDELLAFVELLSSVRESFLSSIARSTIEELFLCGELDVELVVEFSAALESDTLRLSFYHILNFSLTVK